jgi:hypothetical protein
LPEAAIAVVTAFLASGVVLNALKEELPEEREGRFWAFAIGAALFAALLLTLRTGRTAADLRDRAGVTRAARLREMAEKVPDERVARRRRRLGHRGRERANVEKGS